MTCHALTLQTRLIFSGRSSKRRGLSLFNDASMENIGSKCCFCLFLLVLYFVSMPFLFFGANCRTAELREENKSSCNIIHNDVVAMVLLVIGIILFLPLQIVACICYFGFHCLFLTCAVCPNDDNRVVPSDRHDSNGFVIPLVIPCGDS